MAVEVVSRVRMGGGVHVGRMVCHPALPLVAAEESRNVFRSAVHVWDCGGGQLRELGTVSAQDPGRSRWDFAMAWEPDGSLLLAANYEITGAAGPVGGTVARWTPAGVTGLDRLPPTDGYTYMDFSPDGRALWASPSADDRRWDGSDVVDLATGNVAAGQRWDTGVAAHPGGGLAATLVSEAGATLVVFAQVGQDVAPAAMRLLGRALILDNDGYMPPVFSPDGRYLAIRGSSYGHFLDAFEFPSLRHVLAADLDPRRADMSSKESRDWFGAWPLHNIAFGARPGVLWAGTPAGALIETDLGSGRAVTHHVLGGSPVTALSATAAGDLVVATGEGDLALVSVAVGHRTAPALDELQARAAAFLAGTFEVPDDRDLHAHMHLVVADEYGHGSQRTWQPLPPAKGRPSLAADHYRRRRQGAAGAVT